MRTLLGCVVTCLLAACVNSTPVSQEVAADDSIKRTFNPETASAELRPLPKQFAGDESSMKGLSGAVKTMVGQDHAISLHMRKMDGIEIDHLLKGKRMVPDPNIKQEALDFTEVFSSGGDWLQVRDERVRTHTKGYWQADGDQLCTKVVSDIWRCRDVWVHEPSGRYYTTDVSSGSRSSLRIAVQILSMD